MTQKQPTSKYCFVCGRQNPVGLMMDFYVHEPGKVRSELSVPQHFEGYPGVVHGGIIGAILDETGGRALMDEPNRFMVTAQLNIRYRKPVPSGVPLLVIGEAGDRRGRVSHAHSEIQNMDGVVLAEAELVLVDIPESQLANFDPDASGWGVYPEKET